MPLINCEINFMLTSPVNCVISSNVAADQVTIFAIPVKKLYVPVVTLSTQNNKKLLQKLKTGFKYIVI